MNKIFYILLSFIFFSDFCFAQVSNNSVWEIRNTATASNVNGGGFVKNSGGVDYSLQDSAHLSISDLIIGNPNSWEVSSILTPFDNLDIGNILHITAGAGFSTGWYEVVNVVGGVATLDRSAGVAGSENGTAYLGGAISLNSTLDDDFFEQCVSGNVIWIKNGNYSFGETVSLSKTGEVRNNIWIFGYNTNRNTDYIYPENRPFLNTSSNTFTLNSYWGIVNLNIEGTGPGGLSSTTGNIFYCNSKNFSTTIGRNAFTCITESTYIGCNGSSNNGDAFDSSTYPGRFFDCVAHNSRVGFSSTNNRIFILNSLITNNTVGILCLTGGGGGSSIILNNTIVGVQENIGTGILLSGSPGGSGFIIAGNIIESNFTGVGSPPDFVWNNSNFDMGYNCFYDNTYDISPSSVFVSSNTSIFKNPMTKFNYNEYGVLNSLSPCISSYKILSNATPDIDFNRNIGVDQKEHKTLSCASAS